MISEEKVVTLNDIKRFFHRSKKRLLRAALLGAFICLTINLLKPVHFSVRATFKEERESPSVGSLMELVTSTASEPQAGEVLKSRRVLSKVVENLGLQIEWNTNRGLIPRAFGRVWKNVKAELGIKQSDPDEFEFQRVKFNQEEKLDFYLTFTSEESFFLKTGFKKTLQGKLGEPIKMKNIQFTLIKTPKNLQFNQPYSFRVQPRSKLVSMLKNKIEVEANKNNNSLLTLTFPCFNRLKAKKILDEVMLQYQRYLKQEHDQLAKNQLAYLKRRQSSFQKNLKEIVQEHANYLKKHSHSHGFFQFDEEAAAYTKQHIGYLNQLDLLLLEESKLKNQNYHHKTGDFFSLNQGLSKKLSEISQKLTSLESERDFLSITVHDRAEPLPIQEKGFAKLQHIKEEKKEVETLLKGGSEPHLLKDVGKFSARFIEFSKKNPYFDQNYLSDHLRTLNLKEKILCDQLFYSEKAPSEFSGIDLSSAKGLHQKYHADLDKLENEKTHLVFIVNQLQDPKFELTSLTGVLSDPLSQRVIQEVSDLKLHVKDRKNLSEKEKIRASSEVAYKKQFLKEHLGEMISIKDLTIGLLKKKIFNLQKISLDLTNQKIQVLKKEIQDYLTDRKKALKHEKKLISDKMQSLKKQMEPLPSRWQKEQELKLKTALELAVMEGLTKLVESKTIDHKLHYVQSRPLDLAFMPLKADSPRLLVYSIVGAILGFFFSFFFSLFKGLVYGFPLSKEILSYYQKHVSGEISDHVDGRIVDYIPDDDLEALRKMMLFITDRKSKVIGLIGGRGPNYSFTLSSLLNKKGYRVLNLQATFQQQYSKNDIPGILGFLEGKVKKLPIRKEKSYDWVTSGGNTRFGAELLGSPPFKKMIEECKKNYDFVIVYSRAYPEFAEASALFALSDKSIVTVKDETADRLIRFLKEKDEKLSFVTT